MPGRRITIAAVSLVVAHGAGTAASTERNALIQLIGATDPAERVTARWDGEGCALVLDVPASLGAELLVSTAQIARLRIVPLVVLRDMQSYTVEIQRGKTELRTGHFGPANTAVYLTRMDPAQRSTVRISFVLPDAWPFWDSIADPVSPRDLDGDGQITLADAAAFSQAIESDKRFAAAMGVTSCSEPGGYGCDIDCALDNFWGENP